MMDLLVNLRGPAVGVDPADELANTGVDTSKVGAGASLAPRNDTEELAAGVDDGAAGVTLASITTTVGVTGAPHSGGDGRGTVLRAAGVTGDDGDIDTAESSGDAAAGLRGDTPL